CPAPGGDGHAAGAEPGSRKVVHSLWRNRSLRAPAVGDAGTLRGRDGRPRRARRRPLTRPPSAGRPPRTDPAPGRPPPMRRRGAGRPEHGSAAPLPDAGAPAPGPRGPEGPAPDNDPHSPRTPVGALAVPSRRIAV